MDQFEERDTSNQQLNFEPDNREQFHSQEMMDDVCCGNGPKQDNTLPKSFAGGSSALDGLDAQKGDVEAISNVSDSQKTTNESSSKDAISKVPNAGQALIMASKSGDLAVLDRLLLQNDQKGRGKQAISQADLNASLLEACREGRKFIVHKLVRSGSELNVRGKGRCTTPLHLAAEQNFVDIADFLLNKNADVNAQDGHGNSALILAVHRAGSSDMLNLLLAHGAKVNHKNSQGVTALMKAVEVMDIDAVKILMLAGSNIRKRNRHGLTAQDIANDIDFPDVFGFLQNKKQCTGLSYYSCANSLMDVHNNPKALKSLLDCRYLETKAMSKDLPERKYDKNKVKLDTLGLLIKSIGSDVMENKHYETKFEAVKIIVGSGIDAKKSSCNNSCLSKAIIDAVKSGSYELVEVLCKVKNVQINSISNRQSALMVAAEIGRLDILQLLLDLGSDPKLETWSGEMALAYALKNGHIKCASVLLQRYKPPEIQLQRMFKAAVQEGQLESLRFLSSQCDIQESCQGLVRDGILTGDSTIVQFLIAHGANISTQDDLLIALRSRRKDINTLDMVKLLVENGACVNRIPPEQSPLITALECNCNLDVLCYLLEHGADVNEEGDVKANTPLHALFGRYPERADKNRIDLLDVFLKAGADPNKANFDGKTALHLATRHNDLKSVKQLIDAGADLEARDSDRMTPMLLAAGEKCAEVILLLKKCGADMRAVDKDGKNAVFHSIMRGSIDKKVLQLVASEKDQVDIQISDGQTPLMLAARCDDSEAIEVLLEAGADPHKINNKNETALSILLGSFRHIRNVYGLKSLIRHGALLGLPQSYCSVLYGMIINGERELVQLIVTNGMAPICIDFSSKKRLVPVSTNNIADSVWSNLSPLGAALMGNRLIIARYLVENWFLTPADLVGSDQIKIIRSSLESERENEVGKFLEEYMSQPMPLLLLSFVTVSAQLGESVGREERVRKLPLPTIIQDRLLFKKEKCSMDFSTKEENSSNYYSGYDSLSMNRTTDYLDMDDHDFCSNESDDYHNCSDYDYYISSDDYES
ncbi:hypothetical protein EGW08_013839 [Elysia chlorotica]|uniref:Uncharacterized protein n=1 Tax=Elysia chlorotica TaxID=188477 RepID=A0A433T9X9_ELYCH|nr:hypothetical protein EGW08_013839 [Elysia chlorotica]